MKKSIFSMSIGGAITFVLFVLFVLMAFLVRNNNLGIIEVKPPIVVTVYQTPEDQNIEVIDRHLVVPPVTPKMPPPQTVETEQNENETQFHYQPSTLMMKTPIRGLGINAVSDKDARPIVRINPKYPIDASRNGIEGWVKLGFDISTLGEVINVRVLDAKPKRIFDKSAKQAVKKWKYRPKMIEGKPAKQHNFSVQLEFKMDQQS